MKKTLFLIFSGAIVIFSVICICSAPIINKILGGDWGVLNCKLKSDEYKDTKDDNSISGEAKDKAIKFAKKELNLCNRHKAVYGLEYSSLIIDVILAFLCLILGLLHYFDVGKPFEKVTGIIGLATGIIQFILTLVYVCYSGYIFTNDRSSLLKADKDGAIATWDESKNKYKCDFYDKDDEYAIYAKYNEMGKKIYNYNKDMYKDDSTANTCQYNDFNSNSYYSFVNECERYEGYVRGEEPTYDSKYNSCDKLYVSISNSVSNKYICDRWVTTIIFACFIIACDIGLAIFGFFLFKSDSSGI
jgi:hypothetical protein